MGYLDHELLKEEQNAYTYDIASGNLKDQLRLELGDTAVEGAGQTAMLSDKEYEAIIQMTAGQTREKTKMKCIEAIIAKLSYQVNFSIDGMSYSLSDRIKHWEKVLADMKKTGAKPPGEVLGKPVEAFNQMGTSQGTNHYFTTNMLTNPRRKQEID